MKFYFIYYSCEVIIFFSTGLYKAAFSAYYFGETSFWSLVFRVSVFLGFNFNVLSKT